MGIVEVALIGVALATDAFAVALSNCAVKRKTENTKKAFLMPTVFALCQAIMPIIGFFVGYLFYDFLSKISGWLTATIFYVLAIKMIIDFIKDKKETACSVNDEKDAFNLGTLLVQGIATSIDALLIGVTMVSSLTFSIFFASGIIGLITFILVSLAIIAGNALKKFLGNYSNYVCIFILLALATKNLVECLI